ncbi:MAG: SDR family NAD(P)-dependent oxidoreductase [Minwuia sp.]|uniref:SDR family NAD(P)-dependent oxidoreductase n=1 Tax=Minwuia sp. TaxID=2493630 RepID=UPI003A87CFD0
MTKPVCLVLGAGAGIGGTVGARFAAGGYHAVLCRRSNEDGLKTLVGGIREAGGEATGFLLNAVEDDAIEDRIAHVEKEIGPIEVVIFNLGAQIGDRTLQDTTLKQFERGWRMATFALFRTAKALFPLMAERGSGTLIATASTAAMRGNPAQHAHTAAMAGRRMLCQSLNAEYGPQGIHVAHVVVDGMVDAPDTVGLILGEDRFRQLREERGQQDGLILPAHVAETYWHLAHQHRSTWTFELDVRSFSDAPWWNG